MNLGMTLKKALQRFGYDLKYHRPFYETVVRPLGIRTILDIGANDGNYAVHMRTLFPDATVYAFEPLTDCYGRIVEKANRDSHIIPLHYALGETHDQLTIKRSSFHPSSSLLPMTSLHKELYPKSKESSEERIEVRRLDDAGRDLEFSSPLLVKMDVQGYEDRVIRGGSAILSKASIIVVETAYVSLYENQPLFATIHNLLHGLGFVYYGAVERHYDKQGRPLYEDSAFIKAELIT